LRLFQNIKEWFYFLAFIFTIFSFNLFLEYLEFKKLKANEIYEVNGYISNIYPKKNYYILKIKSNHFTFFTSSKKQLNQLQKIQIYIVTKNISFLNYLKNFYAPNIFIKTNKSLHLQTLTSFIEKQHKNIQISSVFKALFLAIELPNKLKEFFAKLGISHLIAISGLHLSIFAFFIYYFFYPFYSIIHFKFFPYRNKKFDLLYVTIFILLIYLYIIGDIASFIRAFIMFIIGVFFLRRGIKIISFESLLITILIVLALFPKFIFSVGFFFSILGVFYIFLFLHYFKNLNKIVLFLLLNFWVFFAINPIIHYFFSYSSFYQLFSPILTILFNIFYPFELIAHLLNFGYILDDLINVLLTLKFNFYEFKTSAIFFYIYLLISFFSTFKKNIFYFLNFLIFCFNFYLFFYIIA